MMSYLEHIRACNACDAAAFRPFRHGGETVGRVHVSLLPHLLALSGIFTAGDDGGVALAPHHDTPGHGDTAMTQATKLLVRAGRLPPPRGEAYAVKTAWHAPTRFLLDRAHVPLFGCRAFGVHLNGFVRQGGALKLWIGRRADDRPVAPGKLDNMVAGGQPAGLSLGQNLLKEAAEEASLPAALAAAARPVGAISYCLQDGMLLRPDTMFLYDLELPADFIPRNTDGEITGFTLMDVDEVADRVRGGHDFKYNVNLVLIDFLIRHGHLTPDDEPDYLALIAGLRHPALA
ncbi:hypothetical protein GALL_87700 [mine drainage metagenome]|uniref:Nudix hydrolase domain-containing protein n=1 Tax=mine drainage metagenome TaxID=410659 RepID=A0A1J5SMI5_9ZZZZ